jgi:hypothetical protein
VKRLVVVTCAALLTSGCIEINFDPPHLVKGPRMLAIVAEPPEIAFGEDVLFEALLVDADGSNLAQAPDVELRFTACVSLAAMVRAAGFGSGGLEDDCDEGGGDLVRLETGGDLPPGMARLRGAVFLELLEDLMGGGTGLPGGGVPIDPQLAAALAAVIAEVGVPLRMRLEVWRDGAPLLVGFKRFAITQRAEPTTNPPPPRFAVGGVWLSARGDDPHRCEPEEGQAPVVDAGAQVTMSPDENEEAWLETYPAVDLDARVVTNEESAYYSWHSTAGSFSADITQRPERDVTWTAPDEPGTYPVWLVVRDGHLGTSFCRADVSVR